MTLAQFPRVLRSVVAAVHEEHWRTRGPGEMFALVEQMHHLADLEEEGFALRIARLLTEDAPALPNFRGDVIARERNYIEQPLLPALERFTAARNANLARFETLSDAEWERAGTQEGVGTVDVRGVRRMMLVHDASHVTELVELLRSLHIEAPVDLLVLVLSAES